MKGKSVLSMVLTTILILTILSAVASAHDEYSIKYRPEAQSAGDTLSHVIDDILADGEPVFLFFYADWCPHCHHQMPVINELEEEYAGEVTFIRVNVTARPGHAAEFGVSGLPTMIVISGMGGDDGDGIRTPVDAAIALRLATSSGRDPVADVDYGGQVTSLDVLMILRAAAGNIELEGCES